MKTEGRIITVKLTPTAWGKLSKRLAKDSTGKTKITHVIETLILENL